MRSCSTLHMPVLDGIETAAILTARHPEVAIVVLTTYADDTSILAALRGRRAQLSDKNADRAEIARALRSASSGLSVLDPAVHAALLAAAADNRPTVDSPRPSRSVTCPMGSPSAKPRYSPCSRRDDQSRDRGPGCC